MSRAIDAVELKISIAYSNILEDGKSLDQIIDEQPTIEPQRKTGRWLKTGQSFVFPDKFRNYFCSECGFEIEKTAYNFCPNCGAKMEERRTNGTEQS